MRTENSMNETRQEPATPAPDQHYGLRNHLRCELRRELEAETSLLAKARRVVRERRQQHGAPAEHFRRVAQVWSVLLGHQITAETVCLCMAASKLVREAHRHHDDNLLDIIGYADCAAEILKGLPR